MLKNILKGMIIGVASLLPGVSGGTMAVSMGVYDKVIHAINHLFTDTKNSVRILFPILIGVGCSMFGSVFGIDYLFEKFPAESNMLFTGLVLGGLPVVYKKVKNEHAGKLAVMTGILFGMAITVFAWLGEPAGEQVSFTMEGGQLFMLFMIGVIAAATLIIPGVSGSMLLLLLGYYQPILQQIKACISGVLVGTWNLVWNSVLLLLPFAIGIAVGILVLAKIIDSIFAKYPVYAYWCILGLIVSSPFVMLKLLMGVSIALRSILLGGILLILGYKAGKKWG